MIRRSLILLCAALIAHTACTDLPDTKLEVSGIFALEIPDAALFAPIYFMNSAIQSNLDGSTDTLIFMHARARDSVWLFDIKNQKPISAVGLSDTEFGAVSSIWHDSKSNMLFALDKKARVVVCMDNGLNIVDRVQLPPLSDSEGGDYSLMGKFIVRGDLLIFSVNLVGGKRGQFLRRPALASYDTRDAEWSFIAPYPLEMQKDSSSPDPNPVFAQSVNGSTLYCRFRYTDSIYSIGKDNEYEAYIKSADPESWHVDNRVARDKWDPASLWISEPTNMSLHYDESREAFNTVAFRRQALQSPNGELSAITEKPAIVIHSPLDGQTTVKELSDTLSIYDPNPFSIGSSVVLAVTDRGHGHKEKVQRFAMLNIGQQR